MSTEDQSSNEQAYIEKGRQLFAKPWLFLKSCPSWKFLPPEGPIEIAFAGRSNVGKSSLINALMNQKGLARTSNTPGRTQELNYFIPDSNAELPQLAVVDMPGYGYAKAPKSQVAAWTKLVFDYLRGRSTLRRVFLLIDSRHGIKANDDEVMALLDEAAVVYQIVMTKSDKIKAPALEKVTNATISNIAKRPAAHPVVLITSSEKKEGMDRLRSAIAELV